MYPPYNRLDFSDLNFLKSHHLEKKVFLPGESITISPGEVHRMEAEFEDSIYLEASTPEMDDVVRLVDEYKR